MRIVFFGSDDFAARHLEEILGSGHEVAACVTPPDKPKGRGMAVHQSPVKTLAAGHGIRVLQLASLRPAEAAADLRAINADIFVVIAYGRLLPQNILDIPPRGAVNVHGSLLPKYRGAAPINWAIINGDELTGVSIIQMNARMDAGDVMASCQVPIQPDDTAVELRARMMEAGAKLLVQTLDDISRGRTKAVGQDEAMVSFAPKLTKELGKIDWSKPAARIFNLVRGLLPWPAAYTTYQGKLFKVLECSIDRRHENGSVPGEVLDVADSGLVVATGRGSLVLTRVHLADAKPMEIGDFLCGHSIKKGHKFI